MTSVANRNFMTGPERLAARTERLRKKAATIREVEARIVELETFLKNCSKVAIKMLGQHSLKINREILAQLKDDYWADEKTE